MHQPSVIVQANVDELIDRERVGLNKYGVTLDKANLSHVELLQHAKEEALDLANYLETAKRNSQMERQNYLELLEVFNYAFRRMEQAQCFSCDCDRLDQAVDDIKAALQSHISMRIARGDFRKDG